MRARLLISLVLIVLGSNAWSQALEEAPTEIQIDSVPGESAAVFHDPLLDILDSLVYQTLFIGARDSLERAMLNINNFDPDSLPQASSETIHKRLLDLDGGSVMKMDYNRQVDNYIRAYLGRNAWTSVRVMGLSYTYFPMFEEIFDRYDIPFEMKYLAVVESALNPTVKSHAGAAGLWQFMKGTGQEFGLRINSVVDERMDPVKSTIAACKYLNRLYSIYGDWNLVLAAYNSGPGNVNKAIRRSGSRDYWELREFLPRETRGYVPAFIAVAYLMNYGKDHNIYPLKPTYTFHDCDTIHVSYRVSFSQLSEELQMPLEDLALLNPAYRRGFIPVDGRSHYLRLPYAKIGSYLAIEEQIKTAAIKPSYVETVAIKERVPASKTAPSSTPSGEPINYTVRSGDVLGVIAERHNVPLSQLKRWNGLRSNTIKPGQKLTIYPGKPQSKESKPAQDPKGQYHTVRKGDTFWDIAKLYDGVSVKDIKTLNRGVSSSRLKLGQKIRIR